MGTPPREIEGKVHEQLYNNILLLTYIYPTSKDFDLVFESTMFVRNNKAAFHQVVHYLLNILNPELIKTKIAVWPIYDVRVEAAFRKELLSYINELNLEYREANIPNIMSSHLICPGGFKFTKFMLKLSQLVLVEHLKKTESAAKNLLPPIKPHKDAAITNIIIDNLKQKTCSLEGELCQMYKEFNTISDNATVEATAIVSKHTEINADLPRVTNTMKEREQIIGYENIPLLGESAINNLDKLMMEVSYMKESTNVCEQGREILSYVTSDASVLEYTKSDNEMLKCTAEEEDKLDLPRLFHAMYNLLENEHLQMPLFSGPELDDANKIITEANNKYAYFNKKLNINVKKLEELVETLQLQLE